MGKYLSKQRLISKLISIFLQNNQNFVSLLAIKMHFTSWKCKRNVIARKNKQNRFLYATGKQ